MVVQRMFVAFLALVATLFLVVAAEMNTFGVRGDLHFGLEARAKNKDGSAPIYKDPNAPIEDRVNDLLPRMTLEEKEEMIRLKGGSIWAGYLTPYEKLVYAINVGQHYLMENTTLGIPALFQSEGLHGFTDNGTIFPSPIGLAASFDTDLVSKVASVASDEAEGLGITHMFAPVLDLSRELRWGRVEENFGEDPFLTGEMGHAFVTGMQSGKRRNVSDTAIARVAATCKHFAAFGSPQGGLNLAQVSGGERELRTMYLKPFNRACIDSLSIMTAYSSYDGIPAIANTHLLTDILRNEWGYKYWVVTDAGSVDLLITLHGTCETRECAAKATVNNFSGEMGGGTYTFLTLPDQVAAGTVSMDTIDETVKTLLRAKFSLGLFENPYPYEDYLSSIRTPESKEILHAADAESIVLLENRQNILPLSTNIGSVALIGPQVDRVTFGDYVFLNASNNGITPLAGFKQYLANVSSSTKINFAEGCKLWSNDESGIPAAVDVAKNSDVAIVMVGTWSLDQTNLWTPGTNATTGEHVDLSDLGLVGAQLALVQAVKDAGKPTIVVLVSGKPVAEPWIQAHADAVIQQFYPGEMGGLAIAEVIFGAVNPSGDTDLTLSSSTITPSQDFNVSVTVHNTGSVTGKEVVQVYMTDLVASVVTPNQELIGFKKVEIPAGGSTVVTIPVLSSQLAVWSVQNKWVVEPGVFAVKVGTSDTVYAQTNLTVT
ncbi:hypothetical protein C0989_006867 [Termitomyces sp. Mn162]|nr:hypothetical protein C0989_006867 [Termitomyces sp. Mn162]